MPKTLFVDFKAVKAAITMEQVLQHYGLRDQFKKGNDSLSGPCPIHKGDNPTQFRVSISKSLWNCFSCKQGGNTLDFIARREAISIHAAAVRAIEWFQLERATTTVPSPKMETADVTTTETQAVEKEKAQIAEDSETPNPPLKFRLEKLEREHPYLTRRGLTLETIVDFGVGYCTKGTMAQRIAIPIHNPKGEVVAYAGRIPGDPTGDAPKYKLPQGFRKGQEFFNIDRAIKEKSDQPLIIVEGFFGCMHLHQHGHRKVVALMGSTMSAAQEELIRRHTNPHSQVLIMLDEDEAGRTGREDIAVRLAKFVWVKVHTFSEENQQPEKLSEDDVATLFH
jgi:DNA primase